MKTKDELHKVIDAIDDEEILKQYLGLLKYLQEIQPADLWNSLSDDEREELLLSERESHDPANLISHEEVKKSHEKWLKQ